MRHLRQLAYLMCVSATLFGLSLGGCDRDEKVLEVETPEGELEIERDADTGNLEVEVDGEEY